MGAATAAVAVAVCLLLAHALQTAAAAWAGEGGGGGGGASRHVLDVPDRHLVDVPERLARAATAVAEWTPCSGVSPWELSDLVEGDIMPSDKQTRLVVANESRKWPNNVIPYAIDANFFGDQEIADIRDAIQELNKLACIHIRETSNPDGDFVRVKGAAQGCWSHVGRVGGEQTVNLQPPACLSRGSILHEFFHAIGFFHTHNSPVRDNYIRIIYENVIRGVNNTFFQKHTKAEANDYGLRYDYSSLMHASRRAQSKNNFDTVETHDPTVTIGLRIKPSKLDIALLHRFLECEGKG